MGARKKGKSSFKDPISIFLFKTRQMMENK